MAVTTTPLSSPIATKLVVDTDSDATSESDVLVGSGTVYMVEVDNTGNGAVSYLKLYDAAAPTIGTTVPDFVLKVPASASRTFVLGAPGTGIAFTNLSFCAVTTGGTAGTTSPTNNVTVRIMAS